MSVLNFLIGYFLGRSHKRDTSQPEAISPVTPEELFPSSAFELVDETISYDNKLDPEQVSQTVALLHQDPELKEILYPHLNFEEGSLDPNIVAYSAEFESSFDSSDSFGCDGFSADGGGE